jgi:hypothetical protein
MLTLGLIVRPLRPQAFDVRAHLIELDSLIRCGRAAARQMGRVLTRPAPLKRSAVHLVTTGLRTFRLGPGCAIRSPTTRGLRAYLNFSRTPAVTDRDVVEAELIGIVTAVAYLSYSRRSVDELICSRMARAISPRYELSKSERRDSASKSRIVMDFPSISMSLSSRRERNVRFHMDSG